MRGSEHYQYLADFGISIWKERSALFQIQSGEGIIGAKCWVLLHGKIDQNTQIEMQNIFRGMMKVLNLQKEDYTVSFLQSNFDGNMADLSKTLASWYPKTLLILGSPLAENWKAALGISWHCPVFTTYHPQELYQAPDKKKEAYRQLLDLKNTLEKM